MKTTDFRVGDFVAIGAWSDWFMRGVKYATVERVGRKYLYVRASVTDRRFKIAPRHVESRHEPVRKPIAFTNH